MTMVDDRNDEQRQAHLTGSKYHAIHGATVRLPTVNLLQQIGARGVKTVSKPECRSEMRRNIQMHSPQGRAFILLRQGRVSPWLLRRESPQRTLLQPALRAAEAFRHVLEPSVPAAKSPQRVRFRGALVAACSALEHQRVLTKLIAQLVDVKSGRHAADCHETAAARPSSTEILKTLYEPIHRDCGRWPSWRCHEAAFDPTTPRSYGQDPSTELASARVMSIGCQWDGPSDLKKGLALRFGRQYSNDISQ